MNHNPAHNPICPKGYKQTEVGVIPEDWEAKAVHDLATIKTGPFGTLLKAVEYSGNNGVPLISVGEIRSGFIKISEHTPLVPENVVRRLPQYVLRKGDIVFGRKGSVERSALIRDEHDGWFLGSDGISLRPSKNNHSEYLAFQFQSHQVQEWLIQNAIGTTMASLNQEILNKVAIPIPPTKAEQEAIAGALSDADALIESLEQLITKKRNLKQGAMQELLTGKKRLPGFEIKPGYKQTEVGVIPEDWDISRLIECTDYVDYRGKTPTKSSSGVLLVTAKNIRFGFIDYEISQEYIAETEYESAMRRGKPCIGDVLITTEAPLGMVAMVDRDNIALAQRVIKYRGKINKILSNYLKFYLLSSKFQTILDENSSGSTAKGIKGSILHQLPVILPHLAEQEAISTILSDMDAEIDALETKLSKTRQLKQGMMQELLTGRIRLI